MKNEINRYEILKVIEPLVENTLMRYDLIPVEVDFQKENHRWFLRIFMYSYNRAVTLDDCEKVSRSLDTFLDEIIPVKYYLEVSSPGLDRKLKSEKEFLIFIGKLVEVKFKKPINEHGEKIIKAKILDAQTNSYIKLLNEKTNEEIMVQYEDIHNARLIIEDNIGEKDD